jgi:hypothetical protein
MLLVGLITLSVVFLSGINDRTALESTQSSIRLSDSVNLKGCHLDTVDSRSSYAWVTIEDAAVVIIDSCTFNAMTFMGLLLEVNADGGSVFLVSSSFTNLVMGSGSSAIIYVRECQLCQIISVSIHVLSGDVTAIWVDERPSEPQVTMNGCEFLNVHAENLGILCLPESAFVSHVTFRSCFPLYFFQLSGSSSRSEVIEATFVDSAMPPLTSVILTQGAQATVRNCHFTNATTCVSHNTAMCFVGCDFQSGGNPECVGISWGESTATLLLTGCQFRDLETASKATAEAHFKSFRFAVAPFLTAVGAWLANG